MDSYYEPPDNPFDYMDDDEYEAVDLDAYAGGGLYSRALGRRPGFALALFLGGLMI